MSDAAPGDGGAVQQPPSDRAPEAPAPPAGDAQPAAQTPAQSPAQTADPSPDQTPAPAAAPAEKKTRPTLVVRYGLMKQIGQFRHNLKKLPPIGSVVDVRTERAVERGVVVANVCESDHFGCVRPQNLNAFIKACGKEYPFRRDGKVLRLANHQDVVDYRHLSSSGHEEATFCREQIDELELPMRLVTVEHLLGGGRIIFYFAAETRIDFRELVRRLASQYHTRIEMRQVGARDEARLVADYERCGQRCCCQQFLQYLRPISMRMAKTQKATLDPSKISGRCGRLMCCLRYEDVGYEDLRKKLPRRNTWVRTDEVTGRVAETQILTQLVRLSLLEGTTRVVSVADIIERDVPPPEAGEVRAPARKPRRGKDASEKPPRGDKASRGDKAASDDGAGDGDQPRKRRKRRRRRKGGEGQPAPQGQAPSEGPGRQAKGDKAPDAGGAKAAEGGRSAPKRRRRRGRRKKKKSTGGQGGSGS